MAKPDVTAADVLAAIREWDALGRGDFLAKYGFGEARRYFLRANGTDYDSKAIVGAAHTLRHGTPLTAAEFSGGEATVQRLLEDLGFEVVVRPSASSSTAAVTDETLGAWVLKCNPDVWDLRGYIAGGKKGLRTWTVVPNYRADMMSYGQRFLFWITGPRDGELPRGFWGAGWVTGEVFPIVEGKVDDPADEIDYWTDQEARDRMTHRVPIALDIWDEPIREAEVVAVDGLEQLEVVRMRQVSNPSWISAELLARLNPLLPAWPRIGERAPETVSVDSQGAGFGDPLTRAVVEKAAVVAVTEQFRSAGYDVVSVERDRCGWDLTCTGQDGSVARVEVKGVSGPKPSVLLTRNEHRSAAQDEGWVLAVVTNALRKPRVTIYTADQVRAAAETFVYTVDLSQGGQLAAELGPSSR